MIIKKIILNKMKDNFYKNLTNILLSIIAIFGTYSLIVLTNVNSKMNSQTLQITLLQQQLNIHQKESEAEEKRLSNLEHFVYKIPN